MTRQIAFKVTSACVGIFLALIVGEALARTVNAWLSRSHIEHGLYVLDEHVGWKLAANASVRQVAHDFDVIYHTDDFGRRVTTNGSDAGKVITIYGDSFAFGIGLRDEDTFASQLSKQLGSVKVINRGVAGYAPDQYYLTFVQDTANKEWRPQYAIFAILPANDFEDLNSEYIIAYAPGQSKLTYKPYLARNGHAFEFVFPSRLQIQDKGDERSISKPREAEYRGIVGLLKNSELLRFLYFRLTEFEAFGFMKRFAQNLNSETVNLEAMNESHQRFNFLVQEIKQSSVPSVFLLIPSEKLLLNKTNGTKEQIAYELARQTLQQNGVDFLDMLSLMPSRRGYYFPNESHWNVDGARLASEALSTVVKLNH